MGAATYLVLGLLSLCGVSAIDNCEKHKTCRECIMDPSYCAWCAAGSFNSTRCKTANMLSTTWCPPGNVQNPKNTVNHVDNVDFSSKLGNVIQIKPQRYKMSLRPGVPANFQFSFKAAEDYPVDLYFLLDASSTMSSTKTTIEQQSENIYNTMLNLTKNIHLGMGSFIDKNAFPYTEKLDSSMTYSFKNRLSLTNNAAEFRKAVSETPFGSNYDEPEGGLDALAQVIRCKDVIKWRNESRKIIVLLTDGPYHSAGDGRVAGIFQPYDGQCYMENNIYTKELEMDYPSVSIINKMASDEEITIIFAVKYEKEYIYNHLSEAISGSKSIKSDKNQIVKLLKDIYDEITQTLKVKVNFKSGQRNNFQIDFNPNCATNNGSECSIRKGEEKHFVGTIKLLKYFGLAKTTVDVVIEGIKEKIVLDIEILKECECESNGIANAPQCSDAGTLQCGICECNALRYGDKCACTANSISNINDNSTCIYRSASTPGDDKLCSGHGSCICGKCACRKNSPYEGEFCQYNKDNCPRINGTVCNGHGVCEGERCFCHSSGGISWTGHACECPGWSKACIGENRKVCSGRGACECGKCVCGRIPPWDARENLDENCNILPCPECHGPQCNKLTPCASCLHSGKTECPSCEPSYYKAELTKYPVSNLNSSWKICPDTSVEIGCYMRFMYKYDDDENIIQIRVHKEKNCVESYYLYGGITLATLVLIGVATIVAWKWLTDARDRREYEKFVRENAEDLSQPCANPTYRPASTTITNPAFRKPSIDVRN